MGYDMDWVDGPDADETAAVDQLRAESKAALAVQDELKAEAGSFYSRLPYEAGNPLAQYVGGSDRWRTAQAEAERSYRAINLAERSYFRLNIFGMGSYRNWMADLGMIHNEGRDGLPTWPKVEDFGFTYDEIDDPAESDDPRAVAYEAALNTLLTYAPEVPGIPEWKFGSNDGWIVSPVECLGALNAWHQAGNPNPAEGDEARAYWLRWIDFLQGAATHGGFRVR